MTGPSLKWRQELTPAYILGSKLVHDHNPDFGVSILAGKVTSWLDNGFRANDTSQASGGSQPTLQLNALDGHAAIVFDGNDLLDKNSPVGVVAGDLPWFYVLASFDDTGSSYNGTPYCFCQNGANESGVKAAHFGTTMYLTYNRTTAVPKSAGPTSALGNNNTPALFVGTTDASNSILTINNSLVHSRAASGGLALTPNVLRFGSSEVAGSLSLIGKLYRAITANATPNAQEHAAMIAYFKAHYPSVPIA